MKSDEIYKKIKGLINSIEFVVGDRLPSEQALAKACGVSRSTLRKAINQLTLDGVIESQQGKGHFVKNKTVTACYPVIADHFLATTELQIKILNFEVPSAPLAIADKLKLNDNNRVYFIRRLFSDGEQPISMQDSFIPVSSLPDLSYADLQHTSLSMLKSKFSQQKLASQLQFIPCLANAEQAKTLSLNKGDVLQQVVSLTTAEGQIAELSSIDSIGLPSFDNSTAKTVQLLSLVKAVNNAKLQVKYLEYAISCFRYDLNPMSFLCEWN